MNSEIDIFEEELEQLDKAIRINKGINNSKVFKVFSLEAASGKTSQLIKSAIKTNKEILIVTKFKAEVDIIVGEINKGCKNPKAAGIVSEVELVNNNEHLYLKANNIEFFKYSVIVITHSAYYSLCKGKSNYLRGLVQHGDVLIIDEEFNPIKNNLFTFKIKDNDEMKEIFTSFGLGEELKELTYSLEQQFIKDDYRPLNQLHWVNLDEDEYWVESTCEHIRNEINKNEDNINVKLRDLKHNNRKELYICDLIKYIDDIETIISNSINGYSLIDINEKTIATYDYNFEYFMLKKNIMLDASASFMTMYKANMFDVVPTERKIDHSNCKITVIKTKTTTSGKAKINHLFRAKLKNYVTKVLGDSESGLIVTKKDEARDLETYHFKDFDQEVRDEIEMNDMFSDITYKDRISFCNYENQRGKNDFAEYKHVFLAHTYRQPAFYYVFIYRYFFGVQATASQMVTANKTGNNLITYWGFHDCDELQQLMFTDMVSSQYQSMKRVARNREPKAHYHIITDYAELIVALMKELHNFNIANYNLIQEIDFLGERVTKRSKLDVLKDYIEERLAQGKWQRVKSSELQKKLNIARLTWNEIWKNEEFLSFCKEKRIKEGKPRGLKINHIYKY